MKTSNKLLLSFVGLIVSLMLVSDTVIWANYKRGWSGDGPISGDDRVVKRVTVTPMPTFKVLKIEGPSTRQLEISKGEQCKLTSSGEKKPEYTYSDQNDTLYLKMGDDDQLTLKCPSLEALILSEGISVNIRELELPALTVVTGDTCGIALYDVKVGRLDVKGGVKNDYQAQGDSSRIDSLYLVLGKFSEVRSFNIPYSYISMDVDSLSVLNLEGRSLNSMKYIK